MEHGLIFPDTERPRVLQDLLTTLHTGYRVLNTSPIYGTEDLVGRAIRESGIPRSEIIVIDKLPNEMHHDPAEALEASLQKLDVGYIDVYLMHWPCAFDGQKPLQIQESPTFVETWKKMEGLVGEKCRGIGVSNFTEKTLEELLPQARVKPVINEIECHPLNPNLKLVPPLAGGPQSHYTPLANSSLFSHAYFQPLAAKHHINVGVLTLSWLVQRGIIPIPHSSSAQRLADNLRLVKLTDEDMETMNSAAEKVGKLRLMECAEVYWAEIPGKGRCCFGWTKEDLGWEDEEGNWLT
ncbi:MAG: hypothetical protein Q9227_005600 [Pyrenula ochraceoflavens]